MPFYCFPSRTPHDRKLLLNIITAQASDNSMAARPPPKANRYFQSAVLDPCRKITSRDQRVYRSADVREAPSPLITGALKITVGSDSHSRRTWYLSKSMLAKHSTYFCNIIQQNPEQGEALLEDVEFKAFGDFVDYMHSCIYSPNTQIVGYRAILGNARAHVLGEKLGVRPYSNAALRQLYMIFEPLARLRTSNARKSPIRASDIKYICMHTLPASNSSPNGSGLRQLFFDAVASHWTQDDILCIGREDSPADTASWTDVYNQYADFRITLATSIYIADVWRGAILRPVDDYLNEWGTGTATERVIAQPRARLPALLKTATDRRAAKHQLFAMLTTPGENDDAKPEVEVKVVVDADDDVLMVDSDGVGDDTAPTEG